ncbi:ceramidase domain-containing protein [Pseudomonadota bacterium]
MIDLYCERLGPGLWAEPLNAVTNLAFFIAAWATWHLAGHRESGIFTSTWVLIALMVIIGMGSMLFHTFAQTWARALDVVPILLFQLVFLGLYCHRILGLGGAQTSLLCLVFLSITLAGREFPHILNGTLPYVPALLALFVLGIVHYRNNRNEQAVLLGAFAVFLVSCLFRLIDNRICEYFPIGTHFLWHLLNAVLLYLVSRSYMISNANHGQIKKSNT